MRFMACICDSVVEIYREEEFFSMENNFCNVVRQTISVATDEDAQKWLEAKRKWLELSNTPNQSFERTPEAWEETRRLELEQEEIMKNLEL